MRRYLEVKKESIFRRAKSKILEVVKFIKYNSRFWFFDVLLMLRGPKNETQELVCILFSFSIFFLLFLFGFI